jgi:lipopolysaccharide/colanic/teichoic acid biosynthesis glycosyltransferase/GT2 family glycosyltransferase
MYISIIVPAYNAESTLSDCLFALTKQTIPLSDYEIIVVDDGSTDRTPEIAQQFPITYIREENQGPAMARNLGAQNAQGEIILFTDSDCIPEPDWIEKMLVPFKTEPDVVGVKGVYLTQQKQLAARFAQAEFEERYERLKKYQYIDFVDSYSAGFKRDVFLSVGGFDPQFAVANNEDVELSYKLAQQNYKMVFQPEAKVSHLHADTFYDYLYLKLTRAYWRMLAYRRHLGKIAKDSYTPQTLKLQVILIFLSILSLLGWIIQDWNSGFHFIANMSSILLLAALISFFILFITTIPFAVTAGQKDYWVGLVSPIYLIGRSLVFLFGAGWGLIIFFTEAFRKKTYPIIKRIFDISIAILCLILLSPILLLIAILIKLTSSGPIIFSHQRLGKNSKYFKFYKFRTMVENADMMKEDMRHLSPHGGPVFKIKNDPRITGLGYFLRKWSLDELPQLFNILNGTMSLVGPRPLPQEDIEHPELLNPKRTMNIEQVKHWLVLRQTVLPGITGLWQVSGRSELPLEGWMKWDMEYIRRKSFLLDIRIILKTAVVVFLGKGAE